MVRDADTVTNSTGSGKTYSPSYSRRGVLRAGGWLAGATAILGLIGRGSPVAAQATSADYAAVPLVGSWMAEVRSANMAGIILITYHADGTIVGTGTDHLRSSPIHGVWVQSAERQFDFTFLRLGFEAGTYFRKQKVHGQITVNEAADEYTGRQVSEMYDLEGKLVVGPNPVMNQARRITVEV
jgi:hypothetical protein